MSLLQVNNLRKIYLNRLGTNRVEALKNVTFSVEQGEFIAIMGESGSGKTTLLNILATLDKPTSGNVILTGNDLQKVKEKQIAAFRRNHLGFIFQDFNLLNTFTIKDNILLPLVLRDENVEEMEQKVNHLAKMLRIEKDLEHYPYEVSGGQKQRTAIARALITNPELLLADEPTGALDSKTSKHLLKVFEQINQSGQTILMVTHSSMAASHASRVLFIKDGVVYHEVYRGNQNEEEFYESIQSTITVMERSSDLHA